MKIVSLVVIFFLFACSHEQPKSDSTSNIEASITEDVQTDRITETATEDNVQPSASEKPKVSSGKFVAKAVYSEGIGWGYDIYEGSSIRIHQPHIPAVEGNRGFSSEAEAIKVAELVIYKLENGIVPPSITKQEMIQAGISNLR
ncbi:MAG: DUF4907 domain-containing protein [Fluviicola sp.]|jgi:hypothetical protein